MALTWKKMEPWGLAGLIYLVCELPNQFSYALLSPTRLIWLNSLLTRALCHLLGLSPGDLTHPALGAGLRANGP